MHNLLIHSSMHMWNRSFLSKKSSRQFRTDLSKRIIFRNSKIRSYAKVDKREEPLDHIDALLFWINKICSLVRDNVEDEQIPLRSNKTAATIPEMEDLYDDLSDGTSVATLLSFYCPSDISIRGCVFSRYRINTFNSNFSQY